MTKPVPKALQVGYIHRATAEHPWQCGKYKSKDACELMAGCKFNERTQACQPNIDLNRPAMNPANRKSPQGGSTKGTKRNSSKIKSKKVTKQ
jgi:hypothetical protein